MSVSPEKALTSKQRGILKKYPLTRIFLRPVDNSQEVGWINDMDRYVNEMEPELNGGLWAMRFKIATLASFSIMDNQGFFSKDLSAEALHGVVRRLVCMGAEIIDRQDLDIIKEAIAERVIYHYFEPEKVKLPESLEYAKGGLYGMLQIGRGLKEMGEVITKSVRIGEITNN
jgi:hypothetical protein